MASSVDNPFSARCPGMGENDKQQWAINAEGNWYGFQEALERLHFCLFATN